jgi:hypothetical protein
MYFKDSSEPVRTHAGARLAAVKVPLLTLKVGKEAFATWRQVNDAPMRQGAPRIRPRGTLSCY